MRCNLLRLRSVVLHSRYRTEKVKVKSCIAVNGTPSHSYGVSLAICGIRGRYLPPNTSEHTPPEPKPDQPVLKHYSDGWKAELS